MEHCVSDPIPFQSSSPVPKSLPSGFHRIAGYANFRGSGGSGAFLEPLSAGRLPKARVFVHREAQASGRSRKASCPEQPKCALGTSQYGVIPPVKDVNSVPTVTHVRGRPYSQNHRPNYFCHARGHLYRGVVQNEVDARAQTDLVHCPQSLPAMARRNPGVPSWIPHDELRDWEPTPWRDGPTRDAFVDDEDWRHEKQQLVDADDPVLDQHSRWGQGFRSISFLHRGKDYKNQHSLQASVQNLPPPTLTERFGINSMGLVHRKNSTRTTQASVCSDGQYSNCSHAHTKRLGSAHVSPKRTSPKTHGRVVDHVATPPEKCIKDGHTERHVNANSKGFGRKAPQKRFNSGGQKASNGGDADHCDDYVGFLIDGTDSTHKSKRTSWLRFLRRKRGAHD